jgi:hypothetical protein
MEYIAKFQNVTGHLLRFDTRIYLDSFAEDEIGVCVGAIVGKNPGSACPLQTDCLSRLELNGDKMLPTVGGLFLRGFRLAGKAVPANAYVRVWNLFYVCNKDLRGALRVASEMKPLPTCPSEGEDVPTVWFGWGGDDAGLNPFKFRFLKRRYKNAFFYDHRAKAVTHGSPAATDLAKHTQGMPGLPVVEHLARVL